MAFKKYFCVLVWVLGLPLQSLSTAFAQESPFSLDLAIGIESDSNVGVDEIDQTTQEGDTAVFVELNAGYETEFTDSTDFSLSYAYTNNQYQTFSAFDSQLHNVTFNVRQEIGKINAELNLVQAVSLLDGERFLTFRRASPALSTFLGAKWYLRGALDITQKEFPNFDSRMADADGFTTSIYYFINSTQTYLSLTYSYTEEITEDSEFTYFGDTLRLRLLHDFNFWQRKWDFSIGFRYQQRFYANPTALIGEKREDKRYQLAMELEMPIWKRYTAGFNLALNNNVSNLPQADYDQWIVGLRFGASF